MAPSSIAVVLTLTAVYKSSRTTAYAYIMPYAQARLDQQEVQLSQRDRAMLRVTEYFAK